MRRNAHPVSVLSKKAVLAQIRKTGFKGLPAAVRRLLSARSSQAQLKLFADFWRVGKIPSIKFLPSGQKKTILAVGMGYTPYMDIASYPRGGRGKRQTIRGNWHAVTRASNRKGVGREIFFSSGRAPGKMRFVGYAPRCWYIPYKDVEKSGSHKAGTNWVHAFSDDGGMWPEVYADTAKLGKKTNFVVRNGTFTVSDWIRR